jgi:hypothetical protein
VTWYICISQVDEASRLMSSLAENWGNHGINVQISLEISIHEPEKLILWPVLWSDWTIILQSTWTGMVDSMLIPVLSGGVICQSGESHGRMLLLCLAPMTFCTISKEWIPPIQESDCQVSIFETDPENLKRAMRAGSCVCPKSNYDSAFTDVFSKKSSRWILSADRICRIISG